jgi:hypothetical protein
VAQPTANAAGDGTFGLGRRRRLIVSETEVRILFPNLFAAQPMTFAIDDIAVTIAEPEEIAERFPDDFVGDCNLPNLAHFGRPRWRKRSNLLFVFARPTLLPTGSFEGSRSTGSFPGREDWTTRGSRDRGLSCGGAV